MPTKSFGYTCPTACGECCIEPNYSWAEPFQADGHCRNWKPDRGCRLPWGQRPDVCRYYLCQQVAAQTPGYDEAVNLYLQQQHPNRH